MTEETTADIYRRRWWILAVLCFALAVIGIDVTILDVAVPKLTEALGATQSDVQWIIDAYSLTFAGLVIAMGSASDKFGRRKFLIIGILAFGVFSGVGAFSRTPFELIIVRGLMGIAAALIMPSTLAVISTIFKGKEKARAVGLWSGVAGLGFIAGPIVGGILLEHFWWGSVLLVNVPVVVVTVALVIWLVPESRDPTGRRIDMVGAALSIIALVSLVFGVIEGPATGWTNPVNIAAFVIAVASGTAFVWWELRTDDPMLDVRLFAVPNFGMPSVVISLTMFVIFGLMLLLPQFFQFVQGYGNLKTGLLLAPFMVTWSVAAVVVPKLLMERIGDRVTIIASLVVVLVGLAPFLLLDAQTEGIILALVGMCVTGVGMGAAVTPATVMLVESLPPAKAGVASAMNDVTREGGGAIGIALLGSVAAAVYTARIDPATLALGTADANTVESGIGGALQVASRIGGRSGAALVDQARVAFAEGFRYAVVAGGAVILVTLAIVLVWRQRPN